MQKIAQESNALLLPSGKAVDLEELREQYPTWFVDDKIREIHVFLRGSGLTWSALEGLSIWAQCMKRPGYDEGRLFAIAFLGAAYWRDVEPDEFFNCVRCNSHVLFV